MPEIDTSSFNVMQPCEELKGLVSHFWMGKWNGGGPNNFIYYSTANTLTELVFAFKACGNQRPDLVFSSILGHTESAAEIPASGFNEMFGVSIFSYAIPCFFNIPTSELMNQYVDPCQILLENSIIDRMANTLSMQDRLEIISNYLKLQLVKRTFEGQFIINATQRIRQSRGVVSIADLASAFSLSQKQFERKFKQQAGFTPKLYSRIIRFESALWNRKKYESLTEVAHAYGYYDQSHFIHEFQSFAGFSPNKFFLLTGY